MNTPTEVRPEYVNYPDAERMTGLSRVTLWKLVKSGDMGWGDDLLVSDLIGIEGERAEAVIDGSAVARAVLAFMNDKPEWEGGKSELWVEARKEALKQNSLDYFPRGANTFIGRLKEALPALASRGLRYSDRKSNGVKLVRLAWEGGKAPGSIQGRYRVDPNRPLLCCK